MGNVHNSAVDYAKQVRDALPASHNTRVAFHVTSRMGNEVAWIQKWIQYSNSEFYKECTFLKSSEKPLSVSEMIDIAEEFGAVEQ